MIFAVSRSKAQRRITPGDGRLVTARARFTIHQSSVQRSGGNPFEPARGSEAAECQRRRGPCGFLTLFPKTEKSSRNLNDSGSFLWQRVKDSNPHIQSQSLLCYLYTNPLYLFISK